MDELIPTTKIGRRSLIDRPASKDNRFPEKGTFRDSLKRASLSREDSRQTVRKSRKTSSAEVRRDLVNKFRHKLEKGSYLIKAEEIADKMVQKIREEKDKIIF